jgi:hypothetical protein
MAGRFAKDGQGKHMAFALAPHTLIGDGEQMLGPTWR